jgi:hypothetical protein
MTNGQAVLSIIVENPRVSVLTIGIKTLAQKHKVWAYCNPELEAEPAIPSAPETLSMEECKKMDEKNWV